jgi:homoserine dehydrogenase
MSEPLRIGIAGLGTVGTGVLDELARHRELIAARCGRAVEVTAVSARSKSKDRAAMTCPACNGMTTRPTWRGLARSMC